MLCSNSLLCWVFAVCKLFGKTIRELLLFQETLLISSIKKVSRQDWTNPSSSLSSQFFTSSCHYDFYPGARKLCSLKKQLCKHTVFMQFAHLSQICMRNFHGQNFRMSSLPLIKHIGIQTNYYFNPYFYFPAFFFKFQRPNLQAQLPQPWIKVCLPTTA